MSTSSVVIGRSVMGSARLAVAALLALSGVSACGPQDQEEEALASSRAALFDTSSLAGSWTYNMVVTGGPASPGTRSYSLAVTTSGTQLAATYIVPSTNPSTFAGQVAPEGTLPVLTYIQTDPRSGYRASYCGRVASANLIEGYFFDGEGNKGTFTWQR